MFKLFDKTRQAEPGAKLVISDYAKYLSAKPGKRALLSYITDPFIAERNGEQTSRFSNSGLALSWARVLNELGYRVDIIDWDNKNFLPVNSYDLVIFHGGKNFNVYNKLAGRPVVIHYLTGSYWKFNNQAEDKRLVDFKRRHGVDLPRDRYIDDPEDPVNRVAKAVIVLGDPSMRKTYPKNLRVMTINNASYADDHFAKITKDYSNVRKNFLFFAGSGNIHKGLDLLIDSFKDLDEHLYIVTVVDKKVMAVFKDELKLPNIHLVGEVGFRSPQFYQAMDNCAFVILPSCSEGQAGSVVEAMNQGLVPIVSKETRLDTGKFGETLKDTSIACIKQTVERLSRLDPTAVQKRAEATRRAAIKDHNPEKFRKDLKAAVNDILETN